MTLEQCRKLRPGAKIKLTGMYKYFCCVLAEQVPETDEFRIYYPPSIQICVYKWAEQAPEDWILITDGKISIKEKLEQIRKL